MLFRSVVASIGEEQVRLWERHRDSFASGVSETLRRGEWHCSGTTGTEKGSHRYSSFDQRVNDDRVQGGQVKDDPTYLQFASAQRRIAIMGRRKIEIKQIKDDRNRSV